MEKTDKTIRRADAEYWFLLGFFESGEGDNGEYTKRGIPDLIEAFKPKWEEYCRENGTWEGR